MLTLLIHITCHVCELHDCSCTILLVKITHSDSLEVGVGIKRVQVGLEDLKAQLVLVLCTRGARNKGAMDDGCGYVTSHVLQTAVAR